MTDPVTPRAASAITPCAGLIGVLLAGFLLFACSSLPLRSDGPRGIYHRVKSGETLGAIARAYHVKLKDLAEINGISNPDRLEVDSVVFIPDVNQVVDDVLTAGQAKPPAAPETADRAPAAQKGTAVAGQKPPRQEPPKPGPAPGTGAAPGAVKEKGALTRTKDAEAMPPKAEPAGRGEAATPTPRPPAEGEGTGEGISAADRGRFLWPVKGKVISRFGDQPNKMRFNGIRIAAPEGAPVVAAASGLVIYSAYLKGYGETVIIEHDDHYATVYTNLETRTVRKDHRVKKGDRIAFLGKSENQEEPYLHFEIRYRYQARNPLAYLP